MHISAWIIRGTVQFRPPLELARMADLWLPGSVDAPAIARIYRIILDTYTIEYLRRVIELVKCERTREDQRRTRFKNRGN